MSEVRLLGATRGVGECLGAVVKGYLSPETRNPNAEMASVRRELEASAVEAERGSPETQNPGEMSLGIQPRVG